MERALSLALILLLLLTACGAKQTKTEVESVSCPAESMAQDRQPAGEAEETASDANPGEELTAVSVPDTQTPTSPKPTQEAAKPTAVNPTQPTTLPEPSAEATTEQAPTTYTGTTITGAFIVKKVQGTLLTLHMYDAAKGGELKSGASCSSPCGRSTPPRGTTEPKTAVPILCRVGTAVLMRKAECEMRNFTLYSSSVFLINSFSRSHFHRIFRIDKARC